MKNLINWFNVLLSIINIFLICCIYFNYQGNNLELLKLKELFNIKNHQPQANINKLNLANFSIPIEKLDDLTELFNSNATINFSNLQNKYLGAKSDIRYFYVDWVFDFAQSYLSFLDMLVQMCDQNLIFKINKIKLQSQRDDDPHIMLNFTVLAYAKN